MSEASVPSTLVKCLYLFFDLPEMSEQEANSKDSNSDFTPKERRILLQKIFVQVFAKILLFYLCISLFQLLIFIKIFTTVCCYSKNLEIQ